VITVAPIHGLETRNSCCTADDRLRCIVLPCRNANLDYRTVLEYYIKQLNVFDGVGM